MIYLDAAYIAKFYVEEPDSRCVREHLASVGSVGSCIHARVEVVSVFHRKLREGFMPQLEFEQFCQQFHADCSAGLWTWFPLEDELVMETCKRISNLAVSVFIRSSDAIHLACAAREGFAEIHTNDRHMITAAPAFGLTAVTL